MAALLNAIHLSDLNWRLSDTAGLNLTPTCYPLSEEKRTNYGNAQMTESDPGCVKTRPFT
jgi:hypothetical protein